MSETTPEIITDWRGTRVMIPVEYGTVRAVWTRAGHAHVVAGSGDKGTLLAYRDRHWNASMHLYAEHGWDEDPADTHKDVFTSWAAGTFKIREVPPTYRAAIVREVVAAVAAFAEAHPEIPAQAEIDHFSTEVSRAEKAEAEARTAYTAANERKHEMAGNLDRAREYLASLAPGNDLAARVTGILKGRGYKPYDAAMPVLNARFTVTAGVGVIVSAAWEAAEPGSRDMLLNAMFGALVQAGLVAQLRDTTIYVPLAGNTEPRGETGS